ncbi:hypothetical protein B0H16DRAFT_952215 [Mycena metata]|uniref:RBR-type E3 ubiquitin transferase n=1 Tax=Mycena metata TaxID=1033252 RepID=A0AAD7K372_9AGAR|nr:hypothetical protein B0H16DRAFT_952215 [Mycena metata]
MISLWHTAGVGLTTCGIYLFRAYTRATEGSLPPEPKGLPLIGGNQEGRSEIVEEILAGREKIVSHVGASQYEAGGIASCGLAALNFVRVVLGRAESGLEGTRLLEDVLSRKTSEEVISICSGWTSNAHLEVEDIFSIPLFKRALTLVHSTYGKPEVKRFREVLSHLQSLPNDHAAVIITRPPEIITCFRVPIASASGKQDVFIIFDSHPRTEHPNGAGLIVNTSLDATAAYLDNLLAVDDRLLTDSSLQWQTQLLANFSGHFFVPRGCATNSVEELTQGVLESSLVALSLQAEVAELKFQNSSLSRDRQALEKELDELYRSVTAVKRRREDGQRSPPSTRGTKHQDSSKLPTSGPSSGSTSLNALDYFSGPFNTIRSPPSPESMDYLVAKQLQMDLDQEHRPRHTFADAVVSTPKDDHSMDEDYMVAVQLQMDWDDDLEVQEKQREFEEEDARLTAERATLQMDVQPIFECGVCFDKYPEDYVSRVADCSHGFCRDCMKGYVISKLEDKLYPIFCPMCVTDNARVEPGMVTDDLVQTLGLDDDKYQTLQELQIASFSILLHCRKCKQSVFVDRLEYEATPILVCPLPRCNYTWCKACQQTIMEGPKHSCDGSSELEHLMKSRGWKHCPGCKTPFQKSSGCNHMTCMSPGCNTHFCYVCGELIVRSAHRREIQTAVSAHYSRCNLFEDVPDR